MVPLMSTARTWSIASSVTSLQDVCPRGHVADVVDEDVDAAGGEASSAIRLMSSQEVMSPWIVAASAPPSRTRSAVCSAPAFELR